MIQSFFKLVTQIIFSEIIRYFPVMSSDRPPDPGLVKVKGHPNVQDILTQQSTPAKQAPLLEGIRPLSPPPPPSKSTQPKPGSSRTPQQSDPSTSSKR